MDDTTFNPPAPKKPSLPRPSDTILESLRTLGGGLGKAVTKDLAGKVASDAVTSLFGSLPKQGELKANQPIDFTKERQPVVPLRRPEIIQRPPLVKAEEIGLKQKIETIRAELKTLSASLTQLNQEVRQAVEEVPPQPGVYHLNFLERLRSIIKILRQQVEDSRTWLSLWTSRKKKISYWGLYKKHGTKFGLSSERTMATQAG